ncbi:Uncharacterised protein [Mycobacteroides abscessus subsp. abscessus]|nr:Uncharacterised protein [Mycobacteroides abscessus subsp. abscessus]
MLLVGEGLLCVVLLVRSLGVFLGLLHLYDLRHETLDLRLPCFSRILHSGKYGTSASAVLRAASRQSVYGAKLWCAVPMRTP